MPATRQIEKLISNFSSRKRHFVRKRVYAEAFADRDLPKIAVQLRDCQETEVLACCTECGKSWYILNRCRLRVCPLCAYTVSLKRAEFLQNLAGKMEYPKFITLTMPLWTHDPHDGIKFLRKCWNSLRRDPIFNKVKGGAYQIELKRKPTGWHIHIHSLLDAPYLPYQRLFTVWRKLIGAQAPQVDIRAATTPEQIRYIAKDVSKKADFHQNPGDVVDWYEATKGHRLFGTFGTWYNITMEELAHEGKLEDAKSVCPHCKAVDSTFLARDGPFIFGPQEWKETYSIMTGDRPLTRPIQEINSQVEKELNDHKFQRQLAV